MDGSLHRQLLSLVKPRIVALLCVTGAFATLAAGGTDPALLAAFLVAGACVAAGSAALNCWYDRELDRFMERTADRPLPSGKLDHRLAFAFALALLGLGTTIGIATLPLASVGFMLAGVAAYVVLYTVLLKRRHWLGVVLGGSAGSFPVLAGWAAVRPLTGEAVVLAAVVFAWTPAHAWALATAYREDFVRADVPTLPVVASSATVRRAVWYAAVATVLLAAVAVPFAGGIYAAVLVVGGACFLLDYWGFYRNGGDALAVRAFFTSNTFLALLFVAWGVGGVLGTGASAGTLLATAFGTGLAFVGLWSATPSLNGVESADAPIAPTRPWTVRRVAEYVRDNHLRGPRSSRDR